MRTWPDSDGSAITCYLRQLRLRSPISPIHADPVDTQGH